MFIKLKNYVHLILHLWMCSVECCLYFVFLVNVFFGSFLWHSALFIKLLWNYEMSSSHNKWPNLTDLSVMVQRMRWRVSYLWWTMKWTELGGAEVMIANELEQKKCICYTSVCKELQCFRRVCNYWNDVVKTEDALCGCLLAWRKELRGWGV